MCAVGTSPGSEIFHTTQWSRVVGVNDADPARRRECFDFLIERYWKPVYAYLRRIHGLNPTEAEDLAQEFFAFLLERDVVERARREVAKFRTYLKTCLRNFLYDTRRKEGRIKRGGDRKIVSLDLTDADERWIKEEAPRLHPDDVLDRMWARAVLERSLRRLRAMMAEEGRAEEWRLFEHYMGRDGETDGATYKEVAERFGLSEWNVWKRLTRALERLKTLMREEIAETVSEPDQVEEEFEAMSALLK